jgi:hypothetical protein
MLRHLRNATELSLYAGFSCSSAFLVRLHPSLFFPVLLLRLAILGYCWYVIAKAEGNKELATVLGAAVTLGWIGGYWDFIEVYLNYDQQTIIFWLTVMILVPIASFALYLQWNNGKNKENRHY